jgi:hypothetical protein
LIVPRLVSGYGVDVPGESVAPAASSQKPRQSCPTLRARLACPPGRASTFAGRAADGRLNYEGVLRIVDLAQSRVEGLRIGFVHAE